MATPPSVQRYGPTTGSVTGWSGVVVAALVAGGSAVGDPGPDGLGIGAVAAAVGLLVWMVMLRPRVLVRLPDRLELRNVFSSWFVPLAEVTGVTVRAMTRVETADGQYVAIGVGRPVKDVRRRPTVDPLEVPDPGSRVPSARTAGLEADLMVAEVTHAAERARADGLPGGPVRRVWALPELGLLGLLAVAGVVLALV